MDFLKGYLSYILALVAIAGAFAGLALGFIEQDTAIQMVWGGLAVFGLRRAIGK